MGVSYDHSTFTAYSLHPITGTRKRGVTEQEDAQLATELLEDQKERAEHVMLVDLGRNDLGRIAERDSVQVERLMEVERFSHAMLRVGVFVDDDYTAIMHAARVARLDAVQLHGNQSQATAQKLQALCSGNNRGQALRIMRVLWPERYNSLHNFEADLEAHAPHCDYFLLDAGIEGGGSGVALSWGALQGLKSPRPWLLAGGLHGDNVHQAIKACFPYGVDFNSGLEHTTGHKDAHKIAAALKP